MTFECEDLLLLKSPQNNVASLKKKQLSQTFHICQGHYEIRLLILQMSQ